MGKITIDLKEYRDLKALEYKYRRLKRDYEHQTKHSKDFCSKICVTSGPLGTTESEVIYTNEEALFDIHQKLQDLKTENKYISFYIDMCNKCLKELDLVSKGGFRSKKRALLSFEMLNKKLKDKDWEVHTNY